MAKQPTREQAWELLTEYNQADALLKHSLAVEAVMRHFAALYHEDVEKWGVIGLLHDLDYEQFPDQHCSKSAEIMRGHGIDEEYIHAVCSHGWGICSDVAPVHRMEKVLYAVDELTGLINAVCLMRPSKSVLDLEARSVLKKCKQKNFAAGVNREVIEKGCQMLGMELSELVQETIQGMRTAAEAIGLKGSIETVQQ
jgi:putative nucleotidyltransferase with HDIG domain